jgi:hypothetical protein
MESKEVEYHRSFVLNHELLDRYGGVMVMMNPPISFPHFSEYPPIDGDI